MKNEIQGTNTAVIIKENMETNVVHIPRIGGNINIERKSTAIKPAIIEAKRRDGARNVAVDTIIKVSAQHRNTRKINSRIEKQKDTFI